MGMRKAAGHALIAARVNRNEFMAQWLDKGKFVDDESFSDGQGRNMCLASRDFVRS